MIVLIICILIAFTIFSSVYCYYMGKHLNERRTIRSLKSFQEAGYNIQDYLNGLEGIKYWDKSKEPSQ